MLKTIAYLLRVSFGTGALILLTACIGSEQRVAPVFSTLLTVPPNGYILTVVTKPIGAFCFIQGARDTYFIDKTPGTITLPVGYEGKDLICEKDGYQDNRASWYVQPIGGNTQYIIQRNLTPLY